MRTGLLREDKREEALAIMADALENIARIGHDCPKESRDCAQRAVWDVEKLIAESIGVEMFWERRLDELMKVLDNDQPEELQAFWDKYVDREDWPCFVQLPLKPEEYSKYIAVLGYPSTLDKASCCWYYPGRSQAEEVYSKLHKSGMLMDGAMLCDYGNLSWNILENRVWKLRGLK